MVSVPLDTVYAWEMISSFAKMPVPVEVSIIAANVPLAVSDVRAADAVASTAAAVNLENYIRIIEEHYNSR